LSTATIINECEFSFSVMSPNRQYLTILGNVDLERLHLHDPAGSVVGPGQTEVTHACGVICFGIYLHFSTTPVGVALGSYVYLPSMVFANSANYMSYDTDLGAGAGGGRNYAVNLEIPLMSVFDFSDADDLPVCDPSRIGIFAALANVSRNPTGGLVHEVNATVKRSSIQAFGLRSGG
jgi:hypothetical protein